MDDKLKAGFADRLKNAAAAKQALIDKLRPKPTRTDPQHGERAGLRAAELQAVREARAADKAVKRQAAADAVIEAERLSAADEEAALLAKRGQRKERKALSAAEAKAKRDAKYAARQARR
jgi:hypothetical protein